jgi:hypothetical protein
MFAVMNEEEKLLYGLFLNSGMRDAEMQNTEYADFNWFPQQTGPIHRPSIALGWLFQTASG